MVEDEIEAKKRYDNKTKKIIIIIFGLLILYAAVSSFLESNELQKYGVPVDAQIKGIEPTKGVYQIDVEYIYNNHLYQNDFGISSRDSLKKGMKVKILVSSRKPDGAMKYLYVIK